MRLKDQVALVTGAGSGIGRSIALRLAEEGATVVVNYIAHPEDADAVVTEIEARGSRAVSIQADVSEVFAVRRMVDEAVAAFGRVDICINNAGVQREVAFLDTTEEDWDLMVAVDLKGTFFVSQACARDMVKRSRGRILNISSVHEKVAKPRFAPYCAAIRRGTHAYQDAGHGTGAVPHQCQRHFSRRHPYPDE